MGMALGKYKLISLHSVNGRDSCVCCMAQDGNLQTDSRDELPTCMQVLALKDNNKATNKNERRENGIN